MLARKRSSNITFGVIGNHTNIRESMAWECHRCPFQIQIQIQIQMLVRSSPMIDVAARQQLDVANTLQDLMHH